MNVRRPTTLAAALAALSAAVVATALASYADTSIGSCHVVATDTVTHPGSTTYYIAGAADTVGTRPVTTTEIRCVVVSASGTVLGSVSRGTAGPVTAFAGTVTTADPGPHYLCTMVDAHYADGSESNPNESYSCQPIQSVVTAPTTRTSSGSTVHGACEVAFSGPSTQPSSTPFHVVGYAAVVTAEPVVATMIRCRLLDSAGTTLGTVATAMPGKVVATTGDVDVATFGPYSICTMVVAYYATGMESNPDRLETCRPV